MAEHLERLRGGAETWNAWRQQEPHIRPYLRSAELSRIDLRNFNLNNVTFSKSQLNHADLRSTNLYQAEFYKADLREANLEGADLRGAKLHNADLRGASLEAADLFRVDFIGTRLDRTNFKYARCATTAFSDVDLTRSLGLDEAIHTGPSNIDVNTLLRMRESTPEVFLRRAGVPDGVLEYLPYMLSSTRAIEFFSCFISYSHKDEEFARILYERMRSEDLRVWFAPEEMKGGRTIHDQIDEAIQLFDKLLIILSRESMSSDWVVTEIRKARQQESERGRRVLFPIRVVDFEEIRGWRCFDSERGKDLAVEIREYFIPDFSHWRNEEAFGKAFDQLLLALRADEGPLAGGEK